MSVKLHVLPQVEPMSFAEFTKSVPTYSIALDGYVRGGPAFEPRGVYANFNHHEDVDRLATRATCGQVLMAIRQGLFNTFQDGSRMPSANLYVNDCDEDVCVATFSLMRPHLILGTMNPIFNRLVAMEETLDATAGAYPYPPDLPVLAELNWVFQPYRIFRLNGGLARRDAEQFRSIIEDVHDRIMAHITGCGRGIPLDVRYDIIQAYPSWHMVTEKGANAKTGMFADGIRAYVAARLTDKRWDYTIGRMSPFVPFDVPGILQALSKADSRPWGGGNTIGGSDRAEGSTLTPSLVGEVIEHYLTEEA